MTYRQALEVGGQVRGGEKSTHIVFTKKLLIKEEGSDDEKRIGMLKAYSVFNVSQIDGLPEAPKEEPVKVVDGRVRSFKQSQPSRRLSASLQ